MAWLSTEFYYYKGSAPCRAVWMTLKMLKVEYEDKQVDLMKAENKRPWFVRLNPQHTLPTINDQGFVLWESRAIMMYVMNKYATEETQYLYPTDPEERARVDRMLFFDMGTLYHAIKEYFAPKMHQGLPPDPDKENLLKTSLDYLDTFLETGGVPYLCGEKYTIADISVLASITELDGMDYSYKCYGEVLRWTQRMKENFPYYKECCEQGVEMTRARVKQLEADLKKQLEKERKQSLTKK
ncbi:glutathione S-transferase 1-like isoform X1 [Penaeus japonicus]|uniref:glutathione S-transferase 1-like isoform X1 n=1 Tax=Penaeus japonicus TaxID=27405 RepID=UPI001C716532|nr:glutathione S-transferase 1-like isoform X1 [Penaeus japonicus]XP_042868023.1 glutathione S-transferase 1-like isoform X1 [Penaeus japonicus]XP_042868024.1 glutathione S-transferase 1-like isoform X1 [Penaeus japonicus]XP_042868025.1 glutathione S-transferase 1-like isoform X1 [Penaeus japonicus]